MSEFLFVVAAVAICLWFITCLVLFVVIIAVFRRGQAQINTNIQLARTIVMLIRALRFQGMVMMRYEKNMAQWYNTLTGQEWTMDTQTRKEYSAILDGIEKMIKTMDLDRRPAEPQVRTDVSTPS